MPLFGLMNTDNAWYRASIIKQPLLSLSKAAVVSGIMFRMAKNKADDFRIRLLRFPRC
jgi:hypothetical protein